MSGATSPTNNTIQNTRWFTRSVLYHVSSAASERLANQPVQNMAGMQFEYDEKGGTFYYFLLSFIALILIPATIYFRPRKKEKGKIQNRK